MTKANSVQAGIDAHVKLMQQGKIGADGIAHNEPDDRYHKLVESLQTYVSGDDIELSREQFLLMVRDRINDDLNAMRRASC